LDKERCLNVPSIIRLIEAGDIDPKEVIFGGPVTELAAVKSLGGKGASMHAGVKAAADEVKKRMKEDLKL